MFRLCITKHSVVLALVGFSLAGCVQHEPAYYKAEADEQVYKIIDGKWQPEFGSKVNYKISDTESSPGDVHVERAVPVSGVLTLPQAVAMATDHNREYQTQREALYIMALDLRLARHDFETKFFTGASAGYGADRNDELIGFDVNAGFNRLFANGTRISTEIAAAWVDVLTGNLRSGLASIFSATVVQPLLRGSDRPVVQENLTQAERDTLYQVRLFNRFRKTFVVSIISQYYLTLQLHEIAQNAQNSYDALVEVCDLTEKLADAGRIPRIELKRVRQAKLQALDIYIQAQKEYQRALDEFKISLSLPTTAEFELDTGELDALRSAEIASVDFGEDEAIETAVWRRLDLANSADAIDDAERKVLVAADGLRGDANLFAGANAISARKGDRRTLRWLRNEFEIGLELDLPADRVAEQNIYRKSLIALNQRQREYEQAYDTVALEVRQAFRDLTEASERYEVQLEALELAQKRFDDSYLLLRYSRASSRRVLNAQDDLFDARNAASEALVAYTIATLNFYRDTGVLHVRPNGMWEY